MEHFPEGHHNAQLRHDQHHQRTVCGCVWGGGAPHPVSTEEDPILTNFGGVFSRLPKVTGISVYEIKYVFNTEKKWRMLPNQNFNLENHPYFLNFKHKNISYMPL